MEIENAMGNAIFRIAFASCFQDVVVMDRVLHFNGDKVGFCRGAIVSGSSLRIFAYWFFPGEKKSPGDCETDVDIFGREFEK